MGIYLYHKYEVSPFNVVIPVALWHKFRIFFTYTLYAVYSVHILCCCFTAGSMCFMCFLYHIIVLGMHGLSWYMLCAFMTWPVGTHAFMAVRSRGNEGITAAHTASTRALTAELWSGWTTVPHQRLPQKPEDQTESRLTRIGNDCAVSWSLPGNRLPDQKHIGSSCVALRILQHRTCWLGKLPQYYNVLHCAVTRPLGYIICTVQSHDHLVEQTVCVCRDCRLLFMWTYVHNTFLEVPWLWYWHCTVTWSPGGADSVHVYADWR